MSMALSQAGAEEDDETVEDTINRIIEARQAAAQRQLLRLHRHAQEQDAGDLRRGLHGRRPGQAPALPPLHHEAGDPGRLHPGRAGELHAGRTATTSWSRRWGTIPEFDTKRAQKKLRRYVEGHEYAIRLKAEIMVDHFHDQVIAQHKIGGQARAMVVTGGIQLAIQYYHAIRDYLQERKSPYRAIVAFSGEHEYGGVKVTEASLNGFPSSHIADRIQEDPYRFLVCADKFQTGYDEPLLHTMYVDKVLSGIKAVQTLSRLNRAHPQKHDTFVLDFMNEADTIQAAFADYYRTTILSEETDPNKLHDLKADLDGYQVYAAEQVDALVELYLGGADRDRLDPILDACVAVYIELDEDGQVDFKGKAKAFIRTYNFLSAILPYTSAEWERLSIFLNFLAPKLPAPVEEDLAKGILEAIDMDSYRAEKQAAMRIALPDADAEIGPVPAAGGGRMARAGAGPALQHPGRVQRSVRESRMAGCRSRPPHHHGGDPAEGRRGHRLQQRPRPLGPAERTHRARQGAVAGDREPDAGRHGAVQAVQRQRVVP